MYVKIWIDVRNETWIQFKGETVAWDSETTEQGRTGWHSWYKAL